MGGGEARTCAPRSLLWGDGICPRDDLGLLRCFLQGSRGVAGTGPGSVSPDSRQMGAQIPHLLLFHLGLKKGFGTGLQQASLIPDTLKERLCTPCFHQGFQRESGWVSPGFPGFRQVEDRDSTLCVVRTISLMSWDARMDYRTWVWTHASSRLFEVLSNTHAVT